ncbi:hypothetical protein, partial [Fulvivirga lutimaris]|uniref:hypothetical protein n=1 Tax=Fulvivirga lutimaris TaxID=1819566 RepID=UPI001C884C22
ELLLIPQVFIIFYEKLILWIKSLLVLVSICWSQDQQRLREDFHRISHTVTQWRYLFHSADHLYICKDPWRDDLLMGNSMAAS